MRTKINIIFFIICCSIINFSCEQTNGHYSSINDSNNETILIGENSFCEVTLSANQIGDEVSVILIVVNSGNNSNKLLLQKIIGKINSVDFKKAKMCVRFGADKIEFQNFMELFKEKQLLDDSSYNLQYYFQFNKTEFESINNLDINLECTLKSNSEEFIFSKEFKMKRHITFSMHGF